MNLRDFRRIGLLPIRLCIANQSIGWIPSGKCLQFGSSVSTKTRVVETSGRCFLCPGQIRSFSSGSTGEEKHSPEIQKTSHHPQLRTTIDEEEVNNFSRLSSLWWDEGGEFKALHSMNELRIPLIRDVLVSTKPLDQYDVANPLGGFSILDIGSGGGILSEPLARLGAFVVGLDASEESIKIAQAHLTHDPAIRDKVKYVQCTVEELADSQTGKFDAVLASEVLEHVINASTFVACACKLVRPGGSIFFTTLNKTRLAYILGVVAAENILRIVPPGTHDWQKFVAPKDLQQMLQKDNFTTRLIHGMIYNPLTNRWSWTKNTSINYAIHAVKLVDVGEVRNDQGNDTATQNEGK